MATDAEAIEAVKRGDKDRYAELVTRYQRMVYGIAWSQLGDNDLCEEAAQETFVRAFRYLVALRHPERFGGWLARIARNKLELAHEYIALGDLGGARALINEVIDSNDHATRADAQALLSTLAPLS